MLTSELKTIISIIAIGLTVFGYIPYIKDILKGKTRPHVYTWFIGSLATAIAFGLQFSAGGGIGSWITLAVSFTAFGIFIVSIPKGKKDITFSDTICLILSLLAMALWLLLKQPILSVILITLVDVLGFAPTVRKCWNSPESETLLTYETNFFRHGISLLALQQYNFITLLYPASWTLINGLFSLLLVTRRKVIYATN